MRSIFLAIPLVLLAFSAAAQSKPLDLSMFKKPVSGRFLYPVIKKPENTIPLRDLSENKMPCFKPDISTITAIPTLSAVVGVAAIPNPFFSTGQLPIEPK